jgi:hypothetical protein
MLPYPPLQPRHRDTVLRPRVRTIAPEVVDLDPGDPILLADLAPPDQDDAARPAPYEIMLGIDSAE